MKAQRNLTKLNESQLNWQTTSKFGYKNSSFGEISNNFLNLTILKPNEMRTI